MESKHRFQGTACDSSHCAYIGQTVGNVLHKQTSSMYKQTSCKQKYPLKQFSCTYVKKYVVHTFAIIAFESV